MEVKLNQSFPDPTEITNDTEFLSAAKTTALFKKVVAEILVWVDGHQTRKDSLEAKLDGKDDESFSIGK